MAPIFHYAQHEQNTQLTVKTQTMCHTPLWRAGKWDKGVPPIENKVRFCRISLSLPSKWERMTAMMIIVATLCHLGGGTEKQHGFSGMLCGPSHPQQDIAVI